MGMTTISCSESTKDHFDELRDDDVRSNDEFLNRLLDHYDEEADEPDSPDRSDGVVGDPISDEVVETLERIESSVSTAEERTGRIERTLEDMGAGR